jgi:hypothetical protein
MASWVVEFAVSHLTDSNETSSYCWLSTISGTYSLDDVWFPSAIRGSWVKDTWYFLSLSGTSENPPDVIDAAKGLRSILVAYTTQRSLEIR